MSSPENYVQMRLEACRGCPKRRIVLGLWQCKVCLCFLSLKARIPSQVCPHPEGSRWPF